MLTGRDEQKRNIGVFWKNTFQNDDGEKVVYLAGNIDAGVLGMSWVEEMFQSS